VSRESETLVEEVLAAWRPRDAKGRLKFHPSWHDLDESGRRLAFEATLVLRRMEAALDPDGLSTTAHAVLSRIPQAGEGGSVR